MPGWSGPLEKEGHHRWIIPQSYKKGMLTHGLIFADEAMVKDIRRDNAPEQVANGAFLPGIVGPSMAMPDIHWGYGLPIGGVVATDAREGVISPGGVGFDGNCGVRLLTTPLSQEEAMKRQEDLISDLAATIPTGVGSSGQVTLSRDQLDRVCVTGARWVVSEGHGLPEDLEVTEENGEMAGADPGAISQRAKKRGRNQLGTLGSGNHFLEVGYVERVFNPGVASTMGLEPGQVTVMVHSGSRGLGHQVCTDYVAACDRAAKEYGFNLPDRQLACAPLQSKTGRDYFRALAGAANYAWANRQFLTQWSRESLRRVFGIDHQEVPLVYDQAHNIAKMETHQVDGQEREVCVHRKGACRALPAGHPLLPDRYRDVGQPVLVPGDMGTASYVMIGLPGASASFFSACHGAGRAMSRGAAKKRVRGSTLREELARQGILVRGVRDAGLAEEAPQAYKDVTRVVEIAEKAGLAGRVAELRPLAVLKG